MNQGDEENALKVKISAPINHTSWFRLDETFNKRERYCVFRQSHYLFYSKF